MVIKLTSHLYGCVSVRQKSCVARLGGRTEGLDERLLAVQGLKERCEEQAKQISALQAQLGKTSICMDVLAITTQHFCHKVTHTYTSKTHTAIHSPVTITISIL